VEGNGSMTPQHRTDGRLNTFAEWVPLKEGSYLLLDIKKGNNSQTIEKGETIDESAS